MSTLWQDIRTQFIQSPSVVIRIIFINVLVFALIGIFNLVLFLSQRSLGSFYLLDYIGVSPNIMTVLYRPWTLITYGFVHEGLLHILFNMLTFYWFGSIFVEFLGNKKVLPVYVLGVLAGAVLFILVYNLFPVFNIALTGPPMIGASAGVLAVVVAAATLLPDYTFFLLIIGPVKLKWLALALVLLDIISIPFGNSGGHIAHLGGAAIGYFYIKQLQSGNDIGKWLNDFFDWVVTLFSPQKLKVVSKNSGNDFNKRKSSTIGNEGFQEKLDVILDKISKSGYESLSAEEKDFLFNYSKKKQ